MDNEYHIRPYASEDRKGVEQLALQCGNGQVFPSAEMRRLFERTMIFVNVSYYIRFDPDLCFVLESHDGKICGSVLCARDFNVWERRMSKVLLNGSLHPMVASLAREDIEIYRPYAAKYPAHLVLDGGPVLFGQGWDKRLLATLEDKLRQEGIPGVALWVAERNTVIIDHYKRLGYKVLGRHLSNTAATNEVILGRRL